jgi:hypothetical protein
MIILYTRRWERLFSMIFHPFDDTHIFAPFLPHFGVVGSKTSFTDILNKVCITYDFSDHSIMEKQAVGKL